MVGTFFPTAVATDAPIAGLDRRLAWLFATSGASPPPGLVACLGERRHLREVQERLVAWGRSVGRPFVGVERVLRYAAEGGDGELDAARRLGLLVPDLLGAHELLLRVCPERDLAAIPLAERLRAQDWIFREARLPAPDDLAALSGAWAPLLVAGAIGPSPVMEVLPVETLSELPPRLRRIWILFARAALGPDDAPALARPRVTRLLAPSTWAVFQRARGNAHSRGPDGTLAAWAEQVSTFVERASHLCSPRAFRPIIRTWLGGGATPTGLASRRRAPSAGQGAGFDLDLVGSVADCRVAGLLFRSSGRPLDVATWLLNEWPEARATLMAAAREAGLDLGPRASVVGLHLECLPEAAGRGTSAFKKGVSTAGLSAWCLAEIDEAVEAARPPNVPARAWRARCASIAGLLPKLPWPASRAPAGLPALVRAGVGR